MRAQYLNSKQIAGALRDRSDALGGFRNLYIEVKKMTGMEILYSHLFNIMCSRRSPNECVLRYLGGTTANVYRIDRPGKSRGKKG